MRIVDNVRPDRQTVMFSATFPRAMEALARRILAKPIEVQVGGRSVVCSDVEQHVVNQLRFISISLKKKGHIWFLCPVPRQTPAFYFLTQFKSYSSSVTVSLFPFFFLHLCL